MSIRSSSPSGSTGLRAYDHLYFHQIGPDQEGFFRFWSEDLQPELAQFETKNGGADA